MILLLLLFVDFVAVAVVVGVNTLHTHKHTLTRIINFVYKQLQAISFVVKHELKKKNKEIKKCDILLHSIGYLFILIF